MALLPILPAFVHVAAAQEGSPRARESILTATPNTSAAAFEERTRTLRAEILAGATPAYLVTLRELNLLPLTPALALTVRGIGALGREEAERSPMPPDALLGLLVSPDEPMRVVSYGFGIDTTNPRLAAAGRVVSQWQTVPSTLDEIIAWGALALVDSDAAMPFLLVAVHQPATPDALALELLARSLASWEATHCRYADPKSCVPDRIFFKALMLWEQAALDVLAHALRTHGVDLHAFVVGLLMRFDPDQAGVLLLQPRDIAGFLEHPEHREATARLLQRVAADPATDGVNRMRAAEVLRSMLLRHDVPIDTEGFPAPAIQLVDHARQRAAATRPAEPPPPTDE